MITSVAVHWVLELGGSGCWACVRGRCSHRHHRLVLDALFTLAVAALTVRILG